MPGFRGITVPRDFKIGMGLGLLIVAATMLWIVSRSDSNMNPAISYENEQPAGQTVSSYELVRAQDNKNDKPLLEILEAEAKEKGLKNVLEMEWPKIHIVQQGQSLSQISNQYYGTPAKWKKILEANRLRLKNKDQIRPDMRLMIPE
jgi:nucleoid-associated protein YgaU